MDNFNPQEIFRNLLITAKIGDSSAMIGFAYFEDVDTPINDLPPHEVEVLKVFSDKLIEAIKHFESLNKNNMTKIRQEIKQLTEPLETKE